MYGTRIKVVRIFNTYGPRMHPFDGRVVSNFICQAMRGEPLTIYGSGMQTRSFCYVDDMIAGFRSMMSSPEELTGPVNLGNPGEFTILELAQIVAEAVGTSVKEDLRSLPTDDPVRRQPDISLAKSALGWNPSVPLREGIKRTVNWFKRINIDDYSPPSPNVIQPEAQ
jgi:UDP-glucuronate decarboxylase